MKPSLQLHLGYHKVIIILRPLTAHAASQPACQVVSLWDSALTDGGGGFHFQLVPWPCTWASREAFLLRSPLLGSQGKTSSNCGEERTQMGLLEFCCLLSQSVGRDFGTCHSATSNRSVSSKSNERLSVYMCVFSKLCRCSRPVDPLLISVSKGGGAQEWPSEECKSPLYPPGEHTPAINLSLDNLHTFLPTLSSDIHAVPPCRKCVNDLYIFFSQDNATCSFILKLQVICCVWFECSSRWVQAVGSQTEALQCVCVPDSPSCSWGPPWLIVRLNNGTHCYTLLHHPSNCTMPPFSWEESLIHTRQ